MEIESIFNFLIEKKRLPQSILIEGKNRWGGFDLAIKISEKLLNYNKTKSNYHPDLNIIEAEKSIKIEQIKSLKEFCYLTPHLSENKVIIIRDANKMTIEASNALLKILEEPLDNRYFIILSENKNLLLPTIVSRCAVFRLKPQKNENLLTDFDKKAIDNLEEFFKEINFIKLSFFDIYNFLEKNFKEGFDNIEDFIKGLILINMNLLEKNIDKEKFRLNITESLTNIQKLLKLNINVKYILSIFSLYLKEKKFLEGVLSFE